MEKKNKILLVEDDRYASRAYSDGLQRAGYQVDTAVDGNKAIELLEENIPDLILLDLILPNLDGYEVLKQLKGSESWKTVPVIVLTNLGQEHDASKARELGADDYMVKVYHSMNEVIERVKFRLTEAKSN